MKAKLTASTPYLSTPEWWGNADEEYQFKVSFKESVGLTVDVWHRDDSCFLSAGVRVYPNENTLGRKLRWSEYQTLNWSEINYCLERIDLNEFDLD